MKTKMIWSLILAFLALSALGTNGCESASSRNSDGDMDKDEDGELDPDRDEYTEAGGEEEMPKSDEDQEVVDGDHEAEADSDATEVSETEGGECPSGEGESACFGPCAETENAYCLTGEELCWCSTESGCWEPHDCTVGCDGYYRDGGCKHSTEANLDSCYCTICENYCCDDEDCQERGKDYCVGYTDDEGNDITTCLSACAMAVCDPGTNLIPCMVTDIAAAPGLCLDESRPTCDTVDDYCGGDQSHWCVKWDDSANLCLEICEPAPDTCEEGYYCVPLTRTDTGEVIGGGCWPE